MGKGSDRTVGEGEVQWENCKWRGSDRTVGDGEERGGGGKASVKTIKVGEGIRRIMQVFITEK